MFAMFEDLVTFEDLTVNFTQDKWALLDSSQKNLYREVVRKIFVTLASVGERWNQNIEDWYRNQGRLLSSHIRERLGDSRPSSHYGETFSQILKHNLKKKSSTEVKLHEYSVWGTSSRLTRPGSPAELTLDRKHVIPNVSSVSQPPAVTLPTSVPGLTLKTNRMSVRNMRKPSFLLPALGNSL